MTALDPKTLYQTVILEHAKAPHNHGPLEGTTHEATTTNPLCGDRVTVRAIVDDGAIRAARFEARGCMIACASASLLTEAVTGKTTEEALALARVVDALVMGEPIPDADTLEPLRGAREFPARRACVTLAWRALERALAGTT